MALVMKSISDIPISCHTWQTKQDSCLITYSMQDIKRLSAVLFSLIIFIIFMCSYLDNLLTALEFIRMPETSKQGSKPSISMSSISSISEREIVDNDIRENARMCNSQERTSHLQKYCKNKYGPDIYSKTLDEASEEELQKMLASAIIDDKHKLIFCSSAKVGSTTFKHMFIYHTDKYIRLHGNERVIIPNVHAYWRSYGLQHSKQFDLEGLRYRLKNYHKVIAVRHPLVRVFSMFRDKLSTPRPEGKCPAYQNMMGRHILQTYRGNLSEADQICPLSTTFGEFMKYYAAHAHKISIDPHLKPYERCFPCHIEYDQVLKLESSADDQLYLVDNFFQLNSSSIHLGNKSTETWKSLKDGFETKVPAYGNVSQNDYEKIWPLYEEDHLRFGYSSKFEEHDGLTATCRIPTDDGSCC